MNDPKDIFKKFSDSSRHVLISSQKIADTMKTGIGSEHILLALTVTSGSIAHEILKENMINIDQIRLIIRFNNLKSIHGQGLSSEAKKLLEEALKAANKYKHTLVEPEHILWAIISNKECLAYKIIHKIGVDAENLKYELMEHFDSNTDTDIGEMLENHMESIGQHGYGFDSPDPGFLFFGPNQLNQTKKMNSAKNQNKSKTPTLDYFSTNLTREANDNKLDPVVGREKELTRIIQILCRRTKNNPVLVGDPGVGKTAVVEALAQKIAGGNVPSKLQGKAVVSLDLALIVAGTMYRGQFEDRIKKIVEEIKKSENIILFLDEIHTMIGTGSAEGSMDTANILKPALAKGKIRLIGATTSEEYRKYIEKDTALERRLQPVHVEEPSEEESIQILKGIKAKYETHHQVKITNEAVEEAVALSKRYIQDRFLPDKAIDLIDEAASAVQIANQMSQKNKKIIALEKEFNNILQAKEDHAEKQNYEEAAKLKTQEILLKIKLQKLQSLNRPQKNIKSVEAEDIAKVVSLWTSIPVTNLVKHEKVKILNLDKKLKEKIVNQDEAIDAITQAIKRSKAGVGNPARPLGAFIFLGPTGVGKTELAKVLSAELFGQESALIKIDMSEFMERHSLSRLVGAPPGYVGYDDAGKLTESIRQHPYSLVLFDEIEKAHPEVFNILLQILEDGYVTDAKGRRVNFRNTLIVLTSNIGTHELSKEAALGFKIESDNRQDNVNSKYNNMKNKIVKQLKDSFKPELINRLDKIIVFKPLDKGAIQKITDLQIEELTERLVKENLFLQVSKEARDHIAKKGFDPEYGARPIKRTISDLIENPLSEKILSGHFSQGDTIKISKIASGLKFEK